MEYLNNKRKSALCLICGFRGQLEAILEENKDDKEMKPYFSRIKTMITYCNTFRDGLLEGMCQEHVDLIARQFNNTRIAIMPEAVYKRRPNISVVDTAVLNRLVNSAFGECFLCQKEKQEARKCQLRSDLLSAGAEVIDNGKGVCPFKRGL